MNFQPAMYRISDAREIARLGNTKIYELIGAGILNAVKAGRRTLITAESLHAYIASLPKADIRTGRPRG